MVQKRSFLHSRRAQVTIFMIVGLLILFVAIFLIQLTSSIRKEQLTGQQEKVFGNLFQKEGLRIGVEDCFHDILEEGIILLGKQGRIWSDQPGGSLEFVESVTGTTPLGSKDRIAYAITNEIYPKDIQSENPYPCDEFNKDQPCPYIFPDSQYGFGEIQLRKDVIEKDLLAYTQAKIKPCVEELIGSKTNPNIKITSDELDLHLKLENDGINVQVKYPLTLKLGGEELFHIADFDFFYDSLFKSFLDAAVVFPLQWDQKFVDFEYTTDTLKTLTFTYASRKSINGEKCVTEKTYYNCQRKLFNEKFNSLDISLEKKSMDNGDDLFIFTLPASSILEKMPKTYTFQFARQNRPPALDYVNRSQCLNNEDPTKNYDYLVIPDDKELGNIDIQLHAKDADEDEKIEYSFENINPALPADNNKLLKGYFVVSAEDVKSLLGSYTFKAIATDTHKSKDFQNVRILIDRPIETSFSIDIPGYKFNGKEYNTQFNKKNGYFISPEDPFFLTITVPEESKVHGVKQKVILTYENDKSEKVSWEIPKDIPITKQETLLFPAQTKATDFNNQDISAFNNYPSSPLKTITENGKLKISFSAAYCQEKEENKKIITPPSQEATIQVKECILHYNPEHPNPYIPNKEFHNLKYKLDKSGKTDFNQEPVDEKISPFLAHHKCCKDWKIIKEKNIPCYEEPPKFGCFGKSEEGKKSPGELLEKKTYTYFCPGDRGNICGGTGHENDVYESQKRCGKTKCETDDKECDATTCINVAPKCEGKPQWHLPPGPKSFFCHGKIGCGEKKQACESFVVDENDDNIFGEGDSCGACSSTHKCIDLTTGQNGVCEITIKERCKVPAKP